VLQRGLAGWLRVDTALFLAELPVAVRPRWQGQQQPRQGSWTPCPWGPSAASPPPAFSPASCPQRALVGGSAPCVDQDGRSSLTMFVRMAGRWTGLMILAACVAVKAPRCAQGAATGGMGQWHRPLVHTKSHIALQVSHGLRGGGVDLSALHHDSSRAGRGRSAAASAGVQDNAKRSCRKLKATVPPHSGPEWLEASCDSSCAEASNEDEAGVCAAGWPRARGVDEGRTGSAALRSDGRPSAAAEGSAARQRGPSDAGCHGGGMRVDDEQETISRKSSI